MELHLTYDELLALSDLATEKQVGLVACRYVDAATVGLRVLLDLGAVSRLLAGRTAEATIHLQFGIRDPDTLVLTLARFHVEHAPLSFLLRPILGATFFQRFVFGRIKPKPGVSIDQQARAVRLEPNVLLGGKLKRHRLRLQRLGMTTAGLELSLTLDADPAPAAVPGNPAPAAASEEH
jgi:hypothetical protein